MNEKSQKTTGGVREKFKKWRYRFAPPGMADDGEWALFLFYCIGASAAILICFAVQYARAYSNLFIWVGGERMLREAPRMPSFLTFLDGQIAFVFAAFAEVGAMMRRYFTFRQGGMSIYTMRRLPVRGETVKRVVTVPMTRCLALCVLWGCTVILCYAAYILLTPAACFY